MDANQKKLHIIKFALRLSLFALFLFTLTRGGGMHNIYIGHFTIEILILIILSVPLILVEKKIKKGE